jgi:hypothetical protein
LKLKYADLMSTSPNSKAPKLPSFKATSRDSRFALSVPGPKLLASGAGLGTFFLKSGQYFMAIMLGSWTASFQILIRNSAGYNRKKRNFVAGRFWRNKLVSRAMFALIVSLDRLLRYFEDILPVRLENSYDKHREPF